MLKPGKHVAQDGSLADPITLEELTTAIQNDGSDNHDFRLVANTNQKKFSARYFIEGDEITSEIALGLSIGEIEVGDSYTVVVRVSAAAKAKPGQAFHGSFAISSTIDPTKVDVVRYLATAK